MLVRALEQIARRAAGAAARASSPLAHALRAARQVHDQAGAERGRPGPARAAASGVVGRALAREVLGDRRGLALDHVERRLGRDVAGGEAGAARR